MIARSIALSLLLAAGCAAPAPDERSQPSDDPITISDSKAGAYEVALAPFGDGLVAAWYDTRDGNAELYMRLLDADGRPAGPERRLTNGPEQSYEASLAAVADSIVIAWYDKSADGTLVPKLGRWRPDGTSQWVKTLSASGRNPVVRELNGRLFSAWIAPNGDGTEAVWSQWWADDGAAIAEPILRAPASKTTWNLNAAAGWAQGAVVFDAAAGTRKEELFFTSRRLSGDDGHASKYPDLAVSGRRFALTWYDERDGNHEVYLRAGVVADLEAAPGELERGARRVTTTKGSSIGAYVAWNGDRIGLAWSDDTAGQHEIYFQPFDAIGNPLAEARRITDNASSSLIPAIVPWRDGFALAWNEYVPGAPGRHAGTSEIAVAVVPVP